MTSIKEPDRPPQLDVGNVVSILISSDFLQMVGLVTSCLAFFKDHATSIIKSPIDLSCISPPLLAQMAAIFPSELLEQVNFFLFT
jgi:hypothetical protein